MFNFGPKVTTRSSSRWSVRRLVVALSALALTGVAAVGGPVSPAIAGADSVSFTLRGDVPNEAGSGVAHVEVLWLASSPKKFKYSGDIRDRCPGDGKGMELRIRVRYVGGGSKLKSNLLEDLNGCGPNAVVLNYPVTATVSKRIKSLRGELWATEGGVPYVRIDASRWKDNPYT